MRKILFIFLIILSCILFYIGGFLSHYKLVLEELENGPIYQETVLTKYLQELYESAYIAGAAKSLSILFGDESGMTYEAYYEWMQKYSEDPDKALEEEGKVWLDGKKQLDNLIKAYFAALGIN